MPTCFQQYISSTLCFIYFSWHWTANFLFLLHNKNLAFVSSFSPFFFFVISSNALSCESMTIIQVYYPTTHACLFIWFLHTYYFQYHESGKISFCRDVLRWGKNISSSKTRTTKRAGVAVYSRASSLETLVGLDTWCLNFSIQGSLTYLFVWFN